MRYAFLLLFDTGTTEAFFFIIITSKILLSFSVSHLPFSGLGRHIVQVCRSHTRTHTHTQIQMQKLVELLWARDHTPAEIST